MLWKELKMTESERGSVASTVELGATWRAVLEVAPMGQTLNARVPAVVMAIAQNVGIPRDYTRVSTADVTRLLTSTGPTVRRALEIAEETALIQRERRRTPGGQPYGVVRFGERLLSEIDQVLKSEEEN